MKHRVLNGCVAAFIAALALAACGGGGGNPLPSGGGGGNPSPSPTSILTPTTTNASGTVVNDANGNPLSGAKVVLMPWGPCGATPSPATSITPENDGCPTPLPSPQATTDANGTFTLNGVPNGQYLLVIGNDVVYTPPPGYVPPSPCTSNCTTPTPAPFVVQAVVHDNVTLTGGNQTLKAPTLQAEPAFTPQPWETNGDYRLATLDATTEMPCYIAWEYERAQHNLAYASVDEWATENVRDSLKSVYNQGGVGTGTTITLAWSGVSGGTDCYNALVKGTFVGNTYAVNPRSLWYSGAYVYSDAQGIDEFPIDPRADTTANKIAWP